MKGELLSVDHSSTDVRHLLAEQGYNAYPDVLRPFMEEAHTQGVTVFAEPQTIEFEEQRVRWRGLPIWEYEPTTSLIRPDEVSGEVLASDQVEGETVALVIRQGNVVFLNGNVLNLDVSFIVNRLLSDVLQAPCYCYGTGASGRPSWPWATPPSSPTCSSMTAPQCG